KSLCRPSTFKEQCKFAGLLRRHRVQILHTYSFYPNVFAIPAARLAGVPTIVASLRDTGEMWTPLQRRVEKVVCRLADHIVVNAEAIRRRLISEGYRRERISVIHNGIALPQREASGNEGPLRQALGLPPRAPLVAMVSRLDRVKGLEDFLDAAAMVVHRIKEARFLVLGDCTPAM